MEGPQDTSDDDMSFELTGPLRTVPFTPLTYHRSPKRGFAEFSNDASFRPAERDGHNGNTRQTDTENDYHSDQQWRGVYVPLWMQWGIFRSLEAIQYTSNALQMAYTATMIATMPIAAAKRRLVSLSQFLPAPAILRRLPVSRRTSRIFRQNPTSSSGNRSTTPITPPKFKPIPPSPYHIPGNFPFSPARYPNPMLPSLLRTRVSAVARAATLQPSAPSNDVGSLGTDAAGAAVAQSLDPSNIVETPMTPQNTNFSKPVQSTVVDEGDIAIPEGPTENDVVESPDYYLDRSITPVYDPVPPLNWTPVPIGAHQAASISELEGIRKRYNDLAQTMSPINTTDSHGTSRPWTKSATFSDIDAIRERYSDLVKAISPVNNRDSAAISTAWTMSTAVTTPQTNESIDSERSSVADETEEQHSGNDGSIASMQSSPHTPEGRVSASVMIVDSVPLSAATETLQQHSTYNELTAPAQSSLMILKDQPSASAGSIDSKRSPVAQVIRQKISDPAASIEIPRMPSAQQTHKQPSAPSESIESTRSPVTAETAEQLAAFAGSIELTRSPVDEKNEQHFLEPTALAGFTQAPTVQKTGQNSLESDKLIDSTRSSSAFLRHQFRAIDRSIEPVRSLSIDTQRDSAMTTILRRPAPQSANKGLIRKLFSSINARTGQISPLGIALNRANAMTTKIHKSARFRPNPISATKKYVKGEAISYPSPISSRDENSILSQTPGNNSYHSPTQEEQAAMIYNQLSSSGPEMYSHSTAAESSELDDRTWSAIPNNGVSEASYPEMGAQNGDYQNSVAQSPITGNSAPETPSRGTNDGPEPDMSPPLHGSNVNSEASGSLHYESDDALERTQSPSLHSPHVNGEAPRMPHYETAEMLGSDQSPSGLSPSIDIDEAESLVGSSSDSTNARGSNPSTPTRNAVTKIEDPETPRGQSSTEEPESKLSPTGEYDISEMKLKPRKARSSDPMTPQGMLTSNLRELSISVRRSSRRTSNKDQLEERLRREQEAIAAEEQARKDRREAEEKALEAKREAEEKARKEKAEAEELARKQAEDEELRKKSRLRMPIEKVIQPLTAEWEQKVAAALALGPTKAIGHTSRGTPITRREIGRVLPQRGTGDPPNGWLNDSVIDAYLQAVVDHGNEAAGQKRGETPKFHAFNSFFYNNLKTGGVDKVRRWASKAKIGGKDLLKVEWVFMPVNVGENHWTLIAVSPTRKTIEYYDSFHGSVSNKYRDIKAWLKHELGSDYKDEEWKTVEDPSMPGMGKGPRQLNGSDCGMHTVTTAKMISLGVDPMAVSRDDMPTQRRRLVAELINGGFTGDFKPNIMLE